MFKNCYSTTTTIINRDEFLEKYFDNLKFDLESTKFGGYFPIHFKNNMRYVEVYKCTDTEYKAIEYNELVDILNEFIDRQFIITEPFHRFNIYFVLGKKY